ncbi:MAG: transposase, partial [Coleofasciculus chthonoplastes F3-SA18-01]
MARGYPFNEVRGRGIAENARGQSPKYFQSLSFFLSIYPMWWYSLAMKQVLTIVVKLQPSPEQVAFLEATLQAFADACNYVNE